MYIEFKEIGLFCKNDVVLELDGYLNILEDESQRGRIEKLIRHRLLAIGSEYIHQDDKIEYKNLLACIRYKKCSSDFYNLYIDRLIQILKCNKVNEVFDRSTVMSSLIWVLGVTANLTCTKAVCENAVRIFKQSGHCRLIKFDKNLLLNIDHFNMQMISLILKFRFSEGFIKFHSGYNALLRPESLTEVFLKIKDIYPDENEYRIFECLMYYNCPLTKYPKDDDYRIVMACRMLSKNGLNFIGLTLDRLKADHNTVEIKILVTYAKRIDYLCCRYGRKCNDIFNNEIPSIESVETFILALPSNADTSKLK